MLGVAGRFGVGGSVTDAETFGTGADTVGTAGTGGGITLYPGGISNVAAGGCTPVRNDISPRRVASAVDWSSTACVYSLNTP